MTISRYDKLAVGDLAYIHPSTRLSEGRVGIVSRVLLWQEGGEPHIEFQPPNGAASIIMDYNKVGSAGGSLESLKARRPS